MPLLLFIYLFGAVSYQTFQSLTPWCSKGVDTDKTNNTESKE